VRFAQNRLTGRFSSQRRKEAGIQHRSQRRRTDARSRPAEEMSSGHQQLLFANGIHRLIA